MVMSKSLNWITIYFALFLCNFGKKTRLKINSVPGCELAVMRHLQDLQFTQNFYVRIKLKSSLIIASLFSNKFELVKTYLNLFKMVKSN